MGGTGEALRADATVAVFGAGAMGAGIAQVAALAGHPVQLHDSRFGAADAAKSGIGDALAKLAAKGKLAAAAAANAVDRISTAVTLPDACVAGLIVEAIVEDVIAKRELFASLENVVAPECVLASNTSSLSITALAAGMKRPTRFVGMHFFNPAPVMPLVEIVSGLATSDRAAAMVFATAKAWGKSPVHARSTPGFIVNRCARPYYAEALRLLAEQAADPATIDALMREAGGFRMGPFELMDLIGLDINFAVTRSVWSAFFNDPRYAPSVIQQELVAAGRLGRKTGRGYYDYADGAAPPAPLDDSAGSAPASVIVCGDLGIAAPIGDRISAAGIAVERARADSRFPDGVIRVPGSGGGVWLALTDGRTATSRAGAVGVGNLAVFDLALDYAKATRIGFACADTCAADAREAAAGALRGAGLKPSRLDDVAGLAVMRSVAMLASEAADAVLQGAASAAAIDDAMRMGVNYPRGPLEWADALGAARVRDVIANLAAHYGEDRYRVSPLLARRAITGGRLHE